MTQDQAKLLIGSWFKDNSKALHFTGNSAGKIAAETFAEALNSLFPSFVFAVRQNRRFKSYEVFSDYEDDESEARNIARMSGDMNN